MGHSLVITLYRSPVTLYSSLDVQGTETLSGAKGGGRSCGAFAAGAELYEAVVALVVRGSKSMLIDVLVGRVG